MRTEIEAVFSLAEKAARLPMPNPTFVGEVRFELLFFFFFLMDYRKFHKLDERVRESILDEFIKRISSELMDGTSTAIAELLCEQRTAAYFKMTKRAQKVGEFLNPAAEYIEAMALFQMENRRISSASADEVEMIWQNLAPEKRGSLAEPIAISISMHGQGLI